MKWGLLPLSGYLLFLALRFLRLNRAASESAASESLKIKAEITQVVLFALLAKLGVSLMLALFPDTPTALSLLELWALLYLSKVYGELFKLVEQLNLEPRPQLPAQKDKCLVTTLVVSFLAVLMVLLAGDFDNRLDFCSYFLAEVSLAYSMTRIHRIFQGVERGMSHPFEITSDTKELRRAVP